MRNRCSVLRFTNVCVVVSIAVVLCGCRQQAMPDAAHTRPARTMQTAGVEDNGAVSSDAKPTAEADVRTLLARGAWPRMRLTSGKAEISCNAGHGNASLDATGAHAASESPMRFWMRGRSTEPNTRTEPARQHGAPDVAQVAVAEPAAAGPVAAEADASQAAASESGRIDTRREATADPDPAAADSADAHVLADLDFDSVSAAVSPCVATGVVRLRYAGKISGDFTALVQRVAAMADRLHIGGRVLDIDSSGGRLEDAMPAGDTIAESRWTIRVGEDAICHSACVLVLAAGDDRVIVGGVGIHRMMRIGSKADSRAQLRQELGEVYGELKEYLERNGASVAVADLMMTVPNRSLRLLSDNELREYGLTGQNAVQDDLDRIRLVRKCGEDFVRRRDAYVRAFDSECRAPQAPIGSAMAADGAITCASDLRARFSFPDARCPADGPPTAVTALQTDALTQR